MPSGDVEVEHAFPHAVAAVAWSVREPSGVTPDAPGSGRDLV